MSTEPQELDIEGIVERAFEYFDTFVARGKDLDGVLLEELKPQEENGWIVSIGFNGQRQESSEPATVGAMAALAGFGSKTTKTVREMRHIYLDKTGTFQKIT